MDKTFRITINTLILSIMLSSLTGIVDALNISGVSVNGVTPPTYLGSYQNSMDIFIFATSDVNANWYFVINSTQVPDNLLLNIANNTSTLSFSGNIDLSILQESVYDLYLFAENVSNISIKSSVLLGSLCVDRTPPNILDYYYIYNSTVNGTPYIGKYTRLSMRMSDNCNLSKIFVMANSTLISIIPLNGVFYSDYFTIFWNLTNEGYNTVEVSIFDEAGNSVNVSDLLYVDLTPPQVINISEEKIIFFGNLTPPNVTFSVTFSEPVILGVSTDDSGLSSGSEIYSGFMEAKRVFKNILGFYAPYSSTYDIVGASIVLKSNDIVSRNITMIPFYYNISIKSSSETYTEYIWSLGYTSKSIKSNNVSLLLTDPLFEISLPSFIYEYSNRKFLELHNVSFKVSNKLNTVYYLVDACDYGYNCIRTLLKPYRNYDGYLVLNYSHIYETYYSSVVNDTNIILGNLSTKWFYISLPFDIYNDTEYIIDLIYNNPYIKIAMYDNVWKDGKYIFGKPLYGYAIRLFNISNSLDTYKNCYSVNNGITIICMIPIKIKENTQTTSLSLYRGWNLIGVYDTVPHAVNIIYGKYIFNTSLFSIRTGPYSSISWVAYPGIYYMYTCNPLNYTLTFTYTPKLNENITIDDNVPMSEIYPMWIFSTENIDYYYPILPETPVLNELSRTSDYLIIGEIDPLLSSVSSGSGGTSPSLPSDNTTIIITLE